MHWVNITHQQPELDKIHFLTNGRTIFMKGTRMQPFLLQLCGEYTTIADFEATHWFELPKLPKE